MRADMIAAVRAFWRQSEPANVASCVRLVRGDIAQWQADALAVSANPYLEGTSRASYWKFAGRKNADGAVRQAGGVALDRSMAKVRSSRLLYPLIPGSAVTSRAGGKLRARWIVHCLSPDVLTAAPSCSRLELRRTYEAAIAAAESVDASSLALPAIGCGVRGFAPDEAGVEAFGVAAAWLSDPRKRLQRLDFVVYSDHVAARWWACARDVLGAPTYCAAATDDDTKDPHSSGLAPGDLVWVRACPGEEHEEHR